MPLKITLRMHILYKAIYFLLENSANDDKFAIFLSSIFNKTYSLFISLVQFCFLFFCWLIKPKRQKTSYLFCVWIWTCVWVWMCDLSAKERQCVCECLPVHLYLYLLAQLCICACIRISRFFLSYKIFIVINSNGMVTGVHIAFSM